METTNYPELSVWQTAMVADGRTKQTARDRVTLVSAVARHAGKHPAALTDADVLAYAEARGNQASTARHLRTITRGFVRFTKTGVTNQGTAPVTIRDLAPYAKWLEEGNYTSTRRLGARRMAKRSASAHAHHIVSISRYVKVHPTRINGEHIQKWLDAHAQTRETYRNRALRAWRYYAEFADVADPTDGIMRFAEPIEEPRPRPAEAACVGALLGADDAHTVAMTVLGAAAGLRRFEIAMVRGTDFNLRNGRWRLRIQGKGNKPRTVMLGANSMEKIGAVCTPGKSRERLFPELSPDVEKAGDQVGDILASAALAAGYVMTAHQLRHYAATTLYDLTKDLEAVRRMLGHSNIATTMKYVQAWTDQTQNDAADAMDAAIGRIAA